MGAAGGGAVVRAGMAGLEGAAAGAACLGAGLAAPVLLERGIVLCVDRSMQNDVYNFGSLFFRLRMRETYRSPLACAGGRAHAKAISPRTDLFLDVGVMAVPVQVSNCEPEIDCAAKKYTVYLSTRRPRMMSFSTIGLYSGLRS